MGSFFAKFTVGKLLKTRNCALTQILDKITNYCQHVYYNHELSVPQISEKISTLGLKSYLASGTREYCARACKIQFYLCCYGNRIGNQNEPTNTYLLFFNNLLFFFFARFYQYVTYLIEYIFSCFFSYFTYKTFMKLNQRYV